MKKKTTPFSMAKIISFSALFLMVLISIIPLGKLSKEQISEDENEEKYDGAALAQQLEFEKTKDPSTGMVPRERLYQAILQTEQLKQSSMRTSSFGVWTERGPNSDVVGASNGNIRANGGITSGRIRAIWVDLADATGKKVWIGGVDGGLWKTTDITSSPATWVQPTNGDMLSNLSVTSICQDPTATNIMYFCTGEAFFNVDAVSGNGVFKSIDGGATWSQLPSTTSYKNCSKILCDAAGNIYLGVVVTNPVNGQTLYRSTKASGGAAWTGIGPSGVSGRVGDFEISSTGRFHLSVGLGNSTLGAYRFTDNPSTVTSATWTSATTPFPFPSGANCRAELACSGNTVYVLPSNNSAQVTTIYKSTDGGVTWAATGTTPSFTSSQAWYCLGIDINPSDPTQVIVGSLDCYKTTDGGATWNKISEWVGAAGQYVHADQHVIKWYDNGNKLLIGCDGGIHFSADGGTTIRDRNAGLRIKQFYSCAINPTAGSNIFLAGAQDNGVHQFSSAGLGSTTEVTGGDGAFTAIDQTEPQYEFGSYVYNVYRRSSNTGGSWGSITFYKGSPGVYGTDYNDFGSFINPFDYDNTNNIMYCGGDANEYFRWSDPQTRSTGTYYSATTFGANASLVPITLGGGTVSTVTVSPYTANRVYFGGSNGRILKEDGANAVPAETIITGGTMPAGYVSCINTGTTDNNLIACFSNYGVSNVWVSTNGGTSWSPIDDAAGTNLPDMPVRWCMFAPNDNTKAIIATETGVWITQLINTASSTATVWSASPTFPTVRTDMLKYRSSDGLLVAATHGRGLWSQNLLSVLPINNFLLKGKWKNNEIVELDWEYSNTNSVTSFDVQSSYNGTDFTTIGTTSKIDLSFLNQPSFSNVYYRIRSKTIQGTITYSNIIHLQKGIDNKDLSGMKIFPNPVKDLIKVAFSASGSGRINYQVTGVNGQLYWKMDEDISSTGDYIRQWNLQQLRPGTYSFTIIYNNRKVVQQFIKQ